MNDDLINESIKKNDYINISNKDYNNNNNSKNNSNSNYCINNIYKPEYFNIVKIFELSNILYSNIRFHLICKLVSTDMSINISNINYFTLLGCVGDSTGLINILFDNCSCNNIDRSVINIGKVYTLRNIRIDIINNHAILIYDYLSDIYINDKIINIPSIITNFSDIFITEL